MKIVIQNQEGNPITIHIPLLKFSTKLIIDSIINNMEEENAPSKRETKKLINDAVDILKEFKGLEIVNAQVEEDGRKITITI